MTLRKITRARLLIKVPIKTQQTAPYLKPLDDVIGLKRRHGQVDQPQGKEEY